MLGCSLNCEFSQSATPTYPETPWVRSLKCKTTCLFPSSYPLRLGGWHKWAGLSTHPERSHPSLPLRDGAGLRHTPPTLFIQGVHRISRFFPVNAKIFLKIPPGPGDATQAVECLPGRYTAQPWLPVSATQTAVGGWEFKASVPAT